MPLWGGRFEGEADASFARFNSSFSFDKRLLRADIEGSVAHVQGLRAAGIVTEIEAAKICDGLNQILDCYSSDPAFIQDPDAEDVHSFVEAELVKLIGDAGYKLHTGRSRNDQVATDLRIFLRGEIDRAAELVSNLQRALISLAEANIEVVMPGYTHLQRAQPILFAHYALAYYEMFKRDLARLADARARVNVLPLGSGALAGTGFNIDRDMVAAELGFDGVCANSLDAVSDRDFVIEFINAAAIAMVHLSRLAEDLIIYSTGEFAFVELSDSVSTGSSLMPQKKNPDSLELVRGKAGRVFGHVTSLLATVKGLPLAYNKDMQEDKEPLFDTVDTLAGSVEVMTIVLRNIRLNAGRMQETASGGYSNATDLADYLVRKGLEFRRAHEAVGRIVKHALAQQKPLENITLAELQSFSNLIGDDVYAALTLKASLASKSAIGGTSPDRVSQALNQAKRELEKGR